MSRGRALPAALALAVGGLSHGASAQFAPGWQFTGSNTARAERYGTGGDGTQSPYQLDLGAMGYDEFNVTGRLQDSPYALWRFAVSGVVNGSPYRSPDDGLVPERLNVLREDGEAAIPYRAEAGDFFAFTSLRTHQRSLKGFSVELQPVPASPGARHSFVFFGGAFQPNWRRAQWGDDNTVGASWLYEHAQAVRLNANVLRSERGAAPLTGTPRRDQVVGSLAGEATGDVAGWKLRAEGEAAVFKGDHEFGSTPAEGMDRSDRGFFAQVTGFDARWNWRLRGERYGRDYRPTGAVVPADRRSREAHVAYAFAGGLALRGRYQDYRDQFDGPNPLETTVVGASLSGPFSTLGLSGALDAHVQDQERADGTLDTRFTNLSLSLSRAFASGLVGQLFLLRQERGNRLDASLDMRTAQVQASLIVPFALGAFRGSVAPGLTYRDVTGAFGTRDWQPTLMLSASGGPHRLGFNAGRLDQGPRAGASPDVATVNMSIDYRYRTGSHEFGVDWTAYDRRPSPGQSTNAYRVGVSWTVFLDPAVTAPPARPAVPEIAVAPLAAAGVIRSPGLLARLAPGANLDASVKALADGGIAGGVRQPNAIVYETRLLAELEQRQRLVLVHDGGALERSALVVSLADQATGDDAARTYERVRRALLDAFGNPSFTFDEGAFNASFASDLAAGRFVRLAEWATRAGGTIRLGIPRRLDGVARIEIHHGRRFPGPRDTAWGLEAVR